MALAAALLAGAAHAQGFDFDSVTRLARERADKPYRASGDKLPAEGKAEAESALTDLKSALGGSDIAAACGQLAATVR